MLQTYVGAVWWWTKTKMFRELNKIKMIAYELYKTKIKMFWKTKTT